MGVLSPLLSEISRDGKNKAACPGKFQAAYFGDLTMKKSLVPTSTEPSIRLDRAR